MLHHPMPLVRLPEVFDHPDWLFELKHDGFRALAYVEGHVCRLVSRRGHEFRKWDVLCVEIAHSVRTMHAVLDGKIVCLDDREGRSQFYPLLFRRHWPYFYAFDLLAVDGEDLRDRPLLERKRRLWAIMPRIPSRLLYVDRLRARGRALFREACARDLEGVVGKWARGRYERDGVSTSWVTIKNPDYSQIVGRRELFEARRDQRQARRRDWHAPTLRIRPESLGVSKVTDSHIPTSRRCSP
jgi:bifunctional non-homologous end joining protein LigD